MEQLNETRSMTFEHSDSTAGMPDEVKNATLGPMMGVAAIALNMAMKYHDIATIQDGTLYQQYKLEGRNMISLHLDHVFETAMQIEKHLIDGNKRVARLMILAAMKDAEADDDADPPDPDEVPATADGAPNPHTLSTREDSD